MPSKLPNIWFKICLSFFLISSRLAFSYPDQEKANLTGLLSSQATAMALENNDFLYVTFGTGISRVDLSSWELAEDQIPALTNLSASGGSNLTGTINGLAVRDRTLFATQSDGDLIVVDLDDVTSRPVTIDLGSSVLGAVVADPESGSDDDKLYIIDDTQNAVLIYDIGDEAIVASVLMTDELGVAASPNSLLFVVEDNGADKVFVTSDSGLVILIQEGVASIGGRVHVSSTSENLIAAAVDPDHDFLFVVNSTETKVHVINTTSLLEVDNDAADTTNKAILLSQNGSLKSVLAVEVTDPVDTYLYVTGSAGISVIDLNISNGVFNLPDVIDFSDTGVSDTENDPLTLNSSTAPGPIIITSNADIITSNGNASFSVLSENPFVSIGSSSLGTGSLTVDGTYTLTFQSDEVGTYSVRVGATLNSSGSVTGTEIATGSVSTADTDITTSSIAYNASLYTEGDNQIFIFVTDADGNVGHDAKIISVDTPPPAVTIRSTGFGDGFVTVNFDRLTTSDIDSYNIYVSTDAAEVTAATTATTSVDHPSSGSSVIATISGLTNLTTYYIAVEAVDASGNEGPRVSTLADGSTRVTGRPEETRGFAGLAGENGCSLMPHTEGSSYFLILFLVLTTLLLQCVKSRLFLSVFFILMFLSNAVWADVTPRRWTFEIQGGVWQPLDTTTKNALGACCDPLGKAAFGYLWKSLVGFEVGAGFIASGGTSTGSVSGLSSNTSYNFSLIPIENSIAVRGHFKPHQMFVPYAKFGPDYVFFRENNNSRVVKGWKMGLHGTVGVAFDLGSLDELSMSAQEDAGINDVYLVVEGRYGWVNSFGASGVDLSALTWTGGLLFEF